MEKEISRCTGHCCKKFTLPFTPAKLRLLFTGKGDASFDGEVHRYDAKEIQTVFLMSKFLGMSKTDPADGSELINSVPVYTCRNYNEVTNDYNIYDHRPVMCRKYPNGEKCRYTECTRTVGEIHVSELYEKEHA